MRFTTSPRGSFGNVARTLEMRGPGQANWDVSIFKSFSIVEKFKGQFRAEALNAFNTPMFAAPNVSYRQQFVRTDHFAGEFLSHDAVGFALLLLGSLGGCRGVGRSERGGLFCVQATGREACPTKHKKNPDQDFAWAG